MTRDELIFTLASLQACGDAMKWVRTTLGNPADLWQACERGDWLLWLAGYAGVARPVMTLAACDCARLALPHAGRAAAVAQRAIEAAEAWTRGEATLAEVRVASGAAAYAAASTVSAAAYAVAAAYVAAYAAAYVAAYVAYAAADAASAAADAAADAASAADARRSTLHRCADLVRARIPWEVVEAALKEQAR